MDQTGLSEGSKRRGLSQQVITCYLKLEHQRMLYVYTEFLELDIIRNRVLTKISPLYSRAKACFIIDLLLWCSRLLSLSALPLARLLFLLMEAKLLTKGPSRMTNLDV